MSRQLTWYNSLTPEGETVTTRDVEPLVICSDKVQFIDPPCRLDHLPIVKEPFLPTRKQNQQGLHKVETLIQVCLKHSKLSHKETEDRNLYNRSGLKEVMAQKRDLSRKTLQQRGGGADTQQYLTQQCKR
jgi:hypothetical protein